MNNKIDLIISPKRALKVLVVIVLLLTIASIIGQTYKYTVGHDRYLVDFFDLDKEWNLPSWYASTTLLFCSLLLASIAFGSRKANGRFILQWIFLSAIFLILALDEGLKLHEQSITPVREFFASIGFASVGFFYYSWVFPLRSL